MIRRPRRSRGLFGHRNARSASHAHCRRCRDDDAGFTLIELLIVTAIMPLIMGALAVGIIQIFKLQSGVSNRLGDSADAQQISAVFSKDVAAAQKVTTDASSSNQPQCGTGTGTLLLGLEGNSNGALYGFTDSYVLENGGTAGTFNLVRLACVGYGAYKAQPTSTTILAYDFSGTAVPQINCAISATTCSSALAAAGWMSTEQVSTISFPVTEPASSFTYTVAASPVNNITSAVSGSPLNPTATTSCNSANPNTGSLSANLCFVDFTKLSNSVDPALWDAATTPGGCATMSVTVGTGDTLFFCINVSVTGSGAYVAPTHVPNYNEAFLGGCYPVGACTTPFYTGISGDPALWLNGISSGTSTATITLTNIELVNNTTGLAETGWQLVSADAESTDANPEFITWSTPIATPLSPVCNGESWDYCPTAVGQATQGVDSNNNYDYWGNACLDDQSTVGLIQTTSPANNPTTSEIQCQAVVGNERETSGQKNGAGMVEAVAPASMTIEEGSNNGLQAVTVGLLVSGVQ